jgi:uncharacterized membrane protein YfcA
LATLAVGLLAAGAVTGLLAGVFGVGGGAVVVPVLYELFRVIGVPEEVRMPLCVGTSLAIIIPTSIRSFNAHRAKGAVDMSILRQWAVPVVIGVVVGSLIARYAPGGSIQGGVRGRRRHLGDPPSLRAAIPGASAPTCPPAPSW